MAMGYGRENESAEVSLGDSAQTVGVSVGTGPLVLLSVVALGAAFIWRNPVRLGGGHRPVEDGDEE
jgi:hypothetical protein